MTRHRQRAGPRECSRVSIRKCSLHLFTDQGGIIGTGEGEAAAWADAERAAIALRLRQRPLGAVSEVSPAETSSDAASGDSVRRQRPSPRSGSADTVTLGGSLVPQWEVRYAA